MNPTKPSSAIITIRTNGDRSPIERRRGTKPRMMPPTSPMILNARTRSASHPAGLPASRSLCAIRSRASIGVTRRATRAAPATTGTMIRRPEALRQVLLAQVHVLGLSCPATCDSSRRTARRRSD